LCFFFTAPLAPCPCPLLVAGCWLLVAGCCLLATGKLLLLALIRPLPAGGWRLNTEQAALQPLPLPLRRAATQDPRPRHHDTATPPRHRDTASRECEVGLPSRGLSCFNQINSQSALYSLYRPGLASPAIGPGLGGGFELQAPPPPPRTSWPLNRQVAAHAGCSEAAISSKPNKLGPCEQCIQCPLRGG
jgi:hypothetical protein